MIVGNEGQSCGRLGVLVTVGSLIAQLEYLHDVTSSSCTSRWTIAKCWNMIEVRAHT